MEDAKISVMLFLRLPDPLKTSQFLQTREWLSCIRNGGTPSCGIKEGFEEAISSHMAGLSYKIGRRIEFDRATEKIIALPGEDLDAILTDTKLLV